MELRSNMRGRKFYLLDNPIAFAFTMLTICCTVVVMASILRLPDTTSSRNYTQFQSHIRKLSKDVNLGIFGEMVIEMLANDLAFTVFLPSETAFNRDLRLRAYDSLSAKEKDNTDAILSRVLGFSTVPRKIDSSLISTGEEKLFDSVSGFKLYVSKSSDGMLVVNGVKSELVDVMRGKIVVHIMDGVIMDTEFQQSVQSEYDDDDDQAQGGK